MKNREEIIQHGRGANIDFIGIGVPRAGTTWLAQCLLEHPEICFSEPKETNFFNRYAGYSYAHHFKHCPVKSVKGEFTPLYYLDESIGQVIVELFPKIKLIVCLRDPAERAISHYVYDKNRFGNRRSFQEVMDEKNNFYIDSGFYYKHLKKFLDNFSRDQVFFVFQEEIKQNPKKIVVDLFSFLGVDKSFSPPSLGKDINLTSKSSYFFPSLNRRAKLAKVRLQSFRLGRFFLKVIKFLGLHFIWRKLLDLNYQSKQNSSIEITDEERNKLRKIYKSDSRELSRAYNLSLPWSH